MGFLHFRTVFVYAVVSVNLADSVIKHGLNPGGLLTSFGLTPSPADYNSPPSRWPAAELSIAAAQRFSLGRVPRPVWHRMYFRTCQHVHAVPAWDAEEMEPILSQLCGPIGKNQKGHRCQWEPACTSVVALLTVQKRG